jgi:DNA-binding response OmpR family regulator
MSLNEPLLLFSRNPELVEAVRSRCGPVFPVAAVDPVQVDVRDAVGACSGVQAVLGDWRPFTESILVALTRRLRRGLPASDVPPVIAICSSEGEKASALLSGADFATSSPISVSKVQAFRVAFDRRTHSSERNPSPIVDAAEETTVQDRPPGPAASGEGRPAVSVGVSPERTRGATPDPPGDGQGAAGATGGEHLVRAGPLTLDRRAKEVRVDGEALSLSSRPFDLMSYLIRHAGECCGRDRLLEEIWGIDFDPTTNVVGVQICKIRSVLEPYGLREIIQTVRGKGYRLCPQEERFS